LGSFFFKYATKALGIGLLSEEKVPGQCVDKQAAPPKTFG
jgi:hypothetical protein